MTDKYYEIRDPIYGFIRLEEWEKKIIDHPSFQRLRRIKQLGITNMVFPSANHTRFEHSLGVMHLASLMFDTIVEHNKDLLKEKLSYNDTGLDKDRHLIRLAALLHDLGHAPFSHSSEEIMPLNGFFDSKEKPLHYTHEDYTEAIIEKEFKDLIENEPFNKSNYGITCKKIIAMINGDASTLREKVFWTGLINGPIDADKCDYLLRDSYHIGVKYGLFDHHRLINCLTLAKHPEDEGLVIALRKDGWHVAESLILSRYQMFTQVYFNKTRRAFDYHLQEAMKYLLKGTLPAPDDLKNYLKEDDVSIWNMINTSDDFHSKVLKERKGFYKSLYSTKEVPTEEDYQMLDQLEKELKGIQYKKDEASKDWYKPKKEDIYILNEEGKVILITEYSSIIRSLREVKKIRLLGIKE